jgi:hypothetical protein
MSGTGPVYRKIPTRQDEDVRKLHSDAAQAAAAAREAGRRVFVYDTATLAAYGSFKTGDALLFREVGENVGLAAIIKGVESQGWRLEHVTRTDHYCTMFFRRLE